MDGTGITQNRYSSGMNRVFGIPGKPGVLNLIWVLLLLGSIPKTTFASQADSGKIELNPRTLNSEDILLKSILFPSWGSWKSEHFLLSALQGAVDLLALTAIIGSANANPDAGAGLGLIIGPTILALNRLIGSPFNIVAAHRYNAYLVHHPQGRPTPNEGRFHAGLNSRLGPGGMPFGLGLSAQSESWRGKLQMGMVLVHYSQESISERTVIAEMRPQFALGLNYRYPVAKAVRLLLGQEIQISQMGIYRYPNETLEPQRWIYEVTPTLGLELVPWSRIGLGLEAGYTVLRSQRFQDFLEEADRTDMHVSRDQEMTSRWMMQVTGTVWVW